MKKIRLKIQKYKRFLEAEMDKLTDLGHEEDDQINLVAGMTNDKDGSIHGISG